jgi:hypothetical protein
MMISETKSGTKLSRAVTSNLKKSTLRWQKDKVRQLDIVFSLREKFEKLALLQAGLGSNIGDMRAQQFKKNHV